MLNFALVLGFERGLQVNKLLLKLVAFCFPKQGPCVVTREARNKLYA